MLKRTKRFIEKRKSINAGNYHTRHYTRTVHRALAIIGSLGEARSILDIGCNQGLTSRLLLERTQADQITGIELSRSTVDKDLLSDERFKLIEGDICELPLAGYYDAIIYGAVHHHIVRKHGLSEAVRVLQKIAESCRGKLFFETGHITEGGRWAWQRKLRQYFKTDEEHIYYLLRSIEEMIAGFEVIGRFRIHGVKRWLLCINMKGEAQLTNSCAPGGMNWDNFSDTDETEKYTRNFGSKKQRLLPIINEQNNGPVEFQKRKIGESVYFVKKALHSKTSLMQEYHIGRELMETWAVQPLSMPSSNTIIFPFIAGKKIVGDVQSFSIRERKLISGQITKIWDRCRIITLHWPKGIMTPIPDSAVLSQVVDLNPNNFLVEQYDGQPRVRVVDFEPRSNHYHWKNKLHIASMLIALKHHRIRAVGLGLSGFCEGVICLLKYQSKSTGERIRDGQPSLSSAIMAEIRSLVGKTVTSLIPSFYEE
ncbi:MAG: class I SAM-dependent methyltransferase [Syntrophales bacterium]|jgi:SAM-dependent methyltransferase|nr:class I SAM-dependent methyltransferase [Syntrophales bacterium]MCK9528807.1 class I SAM-dependent methyltransferase [Syntrophales bacterium]MDX9922754.1 class I SAM-dependent methyltransferase [Syntrophales bacterium]